MKTKKENRDHYFWRNRRILTDQIFIEAMSNGNGYTTQKLSEILKLTWSTVHKHLNRLHERGIITKTRYKKQFLWTIHNEKESNGCGYDV